MASERTPTMSVEEYFELEENNPDARYEYLDGYVYMMSGGSANHATIISMTFIENDLTPGSSFPDMYPCSRRSQLSLLSRRTALAALLGPS